MKPPKRSEHAVRRRAKSSLKKAPMPRPNGTPRPFDEWRTASADRAEDAGHTFGFHLIARCRDEALRWVAPGGAGTGEDVQKAVDTALHNVLDLIEGFWRLDAGPKHTLELVLTAHVRDRQGKLIESHQLSGLDLPVGYWMWARERAFR